MLGGIFPQLSSDGKTNVFSFQGSLWKIFRDGGVMKQLTDKPGFDARPCWSPDGERIAFLRVRGSFDGPVQMIRASDGGTIELPRNVVAKGKLSFSPDGNRLLSIFRDEGGGNSLRWFDIRSGDFGAKLYSDSWGARHALSSDGKSIAHQVHVETQIAEAREVFNQLLQQPVHK